MHNTDLLPLDLPERTIALKDCGKIIAYTFRRLTAEDWARYMNGIVIESKREGGATIQIIDTRSAADDLVKAAILRVEGYKTRDGRRIDETENWQANLPYRHTIPAVNLLQQVSGSQAEREFYFDAATEEVVLQAVWDPVEQDGRLTGHMKMYDTLVHRFSRPTPEQKKRYNRALAESRVVGGARNGRTIHGGRHTTLAKLYDEMIVEVEGYGVGGQQLKSRAEIIAHMDYCHKVTAIDELFSTADIAEEAA